MSAVISLALASSFNTQTIDEQVELAITLKEGDEALEFVRGNAFSQAIASVVKAGSLENVEAYFKGFETAYKGKAGVKSMPGWYRSNKSVLSTALTNGVEILDPQGVPRGKTEIEKDIKATKTGSTPILRIGAAFKVIASNLDHDDFDDKLDLPAVKSLMADLTKRLAEMSDGI